MWKDLKTTVPAGLITGNDRQIVSRCVGVVITIGPVHQDSSRLAGRRAGRTVGAIEEASPDMTVWTAVLITVGFLYLLVPTPPSTP